MQAESGNGRLERLKVRGTIYRSHNRQNVRGSPVDAIRPKCAGLIFRRFFTSIVACRRLITERRGVRLVKVPKPGPSRLPPRIGAWCLRRKANRQRHTKR
jgi:hypothetical protein